MSRQKYKRNVLMPPWASYNTPYIELIQYGRGIGKKVYCQFVPRDQLVPS